MKSILDNLVDMELGDILKFRNELEEYIDTIDEYVITSQTDLTGTITYSSHAFEKISGYQESELIGESHNIVRHPDMPHTLFEEMWDTISQGKVWTGEIKNLKKDGTHYWVKTKITPKHDHNGKHIGYTSVRQDITDKKSMEEIALKDELTDLYNRRFFNKVIKGEINRATRDQKVFSFLILDIDYFKQYNDNYGHQKGDEVLTKVGSFLNDFFKRSGDIAFRLGGEEFCIIYTTNNIEHSKRLAQKLCTDFENLQLEHQFSNVSKFVTISLGLAICDFSLNTEIKIDPKNLYEQADLALYNAKGNGRNQVSVIEII